MMASRIVSDLEFQLLVLLGEGPLNGPGLTAAFGQAVGKEIPHGSLYTTLRRLRSSGHVEAARSRANRREQVFTRTRHGECAVEENRRYYRQLAMFGEEGGR